MRKEYQPMQKTWGKQIRGLACFVSKTIMCRCQRGHFKWPGQQRGDQRWIGREKADRVYWKLLFPSLSLWLLILDRKLLWETWCTSSLVKCSSYHHEIIWEKSKLYICVLKKKLKHFSVYVCFLILLCRQYVTAWRGILEMAEPAHTSVCVHKWVSI